jgi:diacylglycerol kinase family enzyme
MRVVVVVNPLATAMSDRQRDVLAHALGSASELSVEETANRGHAAALACRAMRDGVDVVIALGGDGTVNEVANGLLTDGIHDAVPALGVVPAGSTNVFARALGMPNDPIEATGALLDALRHGRRRAISLGRLEDRWFTFTAGVGFDAAIVAGVEKQRRRGKRSSHLLYARVGIREFLRADRRHPMLHVELPDGSIVDNLHYAIVANCDPWTYVGDRPLRPTPQASFDTGLDLYARRSMGFASTVFGLARMLRKRPPAKGGWGVYLQHDLPGLVLRADEPMPVQVDGDLLEPRDKMQFWSAPEALSVVI